MRSARQPRPRKTSSSNPSRSTSCATSLKAAGVDVNNMAAAEAKLAVETKKAVAAQAEQASKTTLNLKTWADARAEIQRAHAAYNTFTVTGVRTAAELAQAQQALQARIAEVRASVTGVSTAARTGGADLVNFFKSTLLPAAGFTAAIAAVTAGLNAAVEAAKAFNQAIAQIGTISDLSREELDALGKGARQLARDLGIDVDQALRGLFDLLRSGVPPENAIEVLRNSAEAAKAALTDTATGVKAANTLIDNFGADVDDLPALFDKIAVASRNGGATLSEFANSAGGLLTVAKSAGFAFDDLLATLTVLVDKSGNTERSIGDLTKILAKIDTAEARSKLSDLGITGESLVEIFTAIGERGLSLEQVLGLNLSAGGARSAASLAALTRNAKELPAALDKIRNAAGETAKNLRLLYDTPAERAARFDAAVRESAIQIGNFAGSGSRLAVAATTVLNALNDLPEAFQKNTIAGTALDNSVAQWVASLVGVTPAVTSAKEALRELEAQQRLNREEIAKTELAIQKAETSFAEFIASLTDNVKALQAAADRDIADIAARAEAQIAALDKGLEAQAKTAAATLAIRRIAAQQQLEIVQKLEADVTKATEAAIAAREKRARDTGENEKKIAADSARARIESLGPVLAAYERLYTHLIGLAQNEAARARTFEEARVDVARRVESALRDIRLESLSGLDQFVERNREVDRLISEGRKKAAQGDAAVAKGFFDAAIAESNNLRRVVNENGVELVSATQAQTAREDALKKIRVASNEALGDQGEAAKKGADATIKEADRIKTKIGELETQFDGFKRIVAEGLRIKVETDEASVNKAFAKLAELTKPRTVTITVKTVTEGGDPVEIPQSSSGGGSGEHFAHGGLVGALVRPSPALGRMASAFRIPAAPGGNVQRFAPGGLVGAVQRFASGVQRFARGGPVFRAPAWSRVPGSGSGDTVPALLRAGSYVVKKSASQFYGGGLMSALARGLGVKGYAAGGQVTKDDVGKWAKSVFGYDPFKENRRDSPGAPTIDPKKGFKTGDSFQNNDPPINFDTRPIPEVLLNAINVLSYAREMLNSVGQENPLLGSLLPAILSGIKAVERNPNDASAIKTLLQAAETIGANPYIFAMWGKTTGAGDRFSPIWFVDWLQKRGFDTTGGGAGKGVGVEISEFAKRFFERGIGKAGFPRGIFGKAAGGSSTDTVPAMLTPGEFVIRKSAVDRFGVGLLNAVNSMRIPRDMLAGMLAAPVPAHRFATGGPVGTTDAPSSGSFNGGPVTFNLNASAADILTERNIRNWIVPILNKINNQTGK